ncbi:MAG: hypothetical protein CMF96_06295 [Candidatus Marinimicrobia bacterium]|nr:hypothetical protein [Candidatus Neomarinimicrobiota bacterium]
MATFASDTSVGTGDKNELTDLNEIIQITSEDKKDYKDQLFTYIKNHPINKEMLSTPSRAWGCTWPDFLYTINPELPKNFSLAEIGNYDNRFIVIAKKYKKKYHNFIMLRQNYIPNISTNSIWSRPDTVIQPDSRYDILIQPGYKYYGDILYEYIKNHKCNGMLTTPSSKYYCNWPDFKNKYKYKIKNKLILKEIINYDSRFKLTSKKYNNGCSDFVELVENIEIKPKLSRCIKQDYKEKISEYIKENI